MTSSWQIRLYFSAKILRGTNELIAIGSNKLSARIQQRKQILHKKKKKKNQERESGETFFFFLLLPSDFLSVLLPSSFFPSFHGFLSPVASLPSEALQDNKRQRECDRTSSPQDRQQSSFARRISNYVKNVTTCKYYIFASSNTMAIQSDTFLWAFWGWRVQSRWCPDGFRVRVRRQ